MCSATKNHEGFKLNHLNGLYRTFEGATYAPSYRTLEGSIQNQLFLE